MNKLWKNKKICITILVICILILAGVIIGIALKGDKGETETGKGGSGQEIIVHESDEDTVEEKAEGGLMESDSEDGPVLNADNMIDFNGSDASGDNTGDDSAADNADDSTDENPKEDDEEDSEDTGSWGAFY